MKILQYAGYVACCWLVLRRVALVHVVPPQIVAPVREGPIRVNVLAVGDVNLGRAVGQEILKGDTLFPFRNVLSLFRRFDVVIANLESQLSDQNGVTQDPDYNLVFSGPPAGAWTLKYAGVTLVSAANNHALDYGMSGRDETMRYLREAGVVFVGISSDSADLFVPAVFECRGVRFALFACTDLMNTSGNRWKRAVAAADTAALLPALRRWSDSVDVIIVSYHGGEEYADSPTTRTRTFASACVASGADLFLGHHPHVPYGIDREGDAVVALSLGNFVFRQPQRFWTQRSFALACEFTKQGSITRLEHVGCIPVEAGNQPSVALEEATKDTIMSRIRRLSSTPSEVVAW